MQPPPGANPRSFQLHHPFVAVTTDLWLPPVRPSSWQIFVYPELATATCVSLVHGAMHKLLQHLSYDTPFFVRYCQDHMVTIRLSSLLEVVSVDRVKPAFLTRDNPVDHSSMHSHCLHTSPPCSSSRHVHWASALSSVRTILQLLLVHWGTHVATSVTMKCKPLSTLSSTWRLISSMATGQ